MDIFLLLTSTLPLFFLLCYRLIKILSKFRDQNCYILGYECYKAPEERRLTTRSCASIALRNKNLRLEQYRFLLNTIVSSGIGEQTYCPKNVLSGREESPDLIDAITEMDEIMFDTLNNLFAKTRVSPKEVDILVLNVSLLSTSPSLTSRIINHFKMRDNVKSFNLTGMGCSGGVVSIDLVQHLLKIHKNSLAVVVSTESFGPSWYSGIEKSMMLSNCLFREGGCSILFTNNRAFKNRGILKLKTIVRTHLGSDDEAYACCMQLEDSLGKKGALLTKHLTKAAAQALTLNLRILVPKILPIMELVRYFLGKMSSKKKKGNMGFYQGLNLKAGVEHFCIHPGGRAVIDGIGMGLGLSGYDLEPARMALYRWGNTSSGGLWYVLGYMEAKKRLKKGDRILMIGLGAGFKCNTCVWEVMKDLDDPNVWKDCVESYPVQNLSNPFTEKFGWINDECMSFIRLEDYQFSVSP